MAVYKRAEEIHGNLSAASQFEGELRSSLALVRKDDVTKVLEAPGDKKIHIVGCNGVGAIVADGIVVKLDKKEAGIFLENDAYSKIGDRFAGKTPTASKVIDALLKKPEALGFRFDHVPQILKVMSELKLDTVEFGVKDKKELDGLAELLLEQHWAVSRVSGYKAMGAARKHAREEIAQLLGSDKVNAALARYGMKERVDERIVKVHQEETVVEETGEEELATPKQKVRFKRGSEKQIKEEMLEKLKLRDKGMVDEKVAGMEVVALGNLIAVNINDFLVVKARAGWASVLMCKDFPPLDLKMRGSAEDLSDSHRAIIMSDERLGEGYVATEAAMKELGVRKFVLSTARHGAEYYMGAVRRDYDLPSRFIKEFHSSKSLASAISSAMEGVSQEELVKELNDVGMSKEAEQVDKYLNALKSSRKVVEGYLDEWCKKGVPSKEELLELMSPQVLERILGEEIAEMKKSIGRISNSIEASKASLKKWREEDVVLHSDLAEEQIKKYIADDERRRIELANKIAKAGEALRILKG